MLNYFQSKNAPAEIVCAKSEQAGARSDRTKDYLFSVARKLIPRAQLGINELRPIGFRFVVGEGES
jgi:hypothetical protein